MLSNVDIGACPDHNSGHRRANTAATTYLKRGELDQALACFVAALSSKQNFPPALYGIGETFAKRTPSGFEMARESYELSLKHWPEFVDAHIALGDLWADRGDRTRAEMHYESATKTRPKDALAWDALARNQMNDGRLDQAVETYDTAIDSVVNEVPGLYFSRGRAQLLREEFEACANDASHALKTSSQFGQAYHLLAVCSLKLSGPNAPSTNDVETYFRQATQLEPEFADHFLDFARFVYDDDHARESEARRIIEIGLEGDLEDGERAKLEDGLSKFNEFVTSTKASRDEL